MASPHVTNVHKLVQYISLTPGVTDIKYCPACSMCEFTEPYSMYKSRENYVYCETCCAYKKLDSLLEISAEEYVTILMSIPLMYDGYSRWSAAVSEKYQANGKFRSYSELTQEELHELDFIV